jgi:hypothetical protein
VMTLVTTLVTPVLLRFLLTDRAAATPDDPRVPADTLILEQLERVEV